MQRGDTKSPRLQYFFMLNSTEHEILAARETNGIE